MGEIYKPEDFEGKKIPPIPDIKPTGPRRPSPYPGYEAILEEIRAIKVEIEKIKRALKLHGIPID